MNRFSSAVPDRERRRLLIALAVSPLLFALPGRAASYPDSDKIVALEWLPTELLMALGATPLGVADIHNYRQWVEEPKLPASVIDVGQRTEPNLELLQKLAPSLILLSEGYGPTPQKLAPIAPSMSFAFNTPGGSPFASGRKSVRALGQRLGMEKAAERHLAELDAFILAARGRLQGYNSGSLLMFSLLDSRHALVIGQNSLFQGVLDELNIKNAWQGETNLWGSTIVGIERLAQINPGKAICFNHSNDQLLKQVSSTPLWQSMSFVRQQRLRVLPPVWFYGATLSAMRFVRLLEQALEQPS